MQHAGGGLLSPVYPRRLRESREPHAAAASSLPSPIADDNPGFRHQRGTGLAAGGVLLTATFPPLWTT